MRRSTAFLAVLCLLVACGPEPTPTPLPPADTPAPTPAPTPSPTPTPPPAFVRDTVGALEELESFRLAETLSWEGTAADGSPLTEATTATLEYAAQPPALHALLCGESEDLADQRDEMGIAEGKPVEVFLVEGTLYVPGFGGWVMVSTQQAGQIGFGLDAEDLLADETERLRWIRGAEFEGTEVVNGLAANRFGLDAASLDADAMPQGMVVETARGTLWLAVVGNVPVRLTLEITGRNLRLSGSKDAPRLRDGTLRLTTDLWDINSTQVTEPPEEALTATQLPDDIPAPAGARQFVGMSGEIYGETMQVYGLYTDLDPDAAAVLYRGEMPKRGWTELEGGQNSASHWLVYGKQDLSASVQIAPDRETGQTTVLVEIESGFEIPEPTPTPAAEPFPCADPMGCVHILPGEPVRLAAMLATTGSNAPLGIDALRGVRLALQEQPEVLGHPIELAEEATQCNAESGTVAGAKLAEDPSLVAVIGPSCSSEARASLPFLCGAGLSVVSPSNTAADLTMVDRPGEHWCYLRTSWNDRAQGQAAARFAWQELGVKRAATIHDGSLYGDLLVREFASEFAALGGTITSEEAISPLPVDLAPVLARIAVTEPELLYYPIFVQAGAQLTRQARETGGLEEVALLSGDGTMTADLLRAAGEAAAGMYWTSPETSGPDYTAFVERYEAQFGERPLSPFHAHAYDAVRLVLAAVERAAVQDAHGTLHIGRQALHEALYATAGFPGVTGLLTCNSSGDCGAATFAVYQCVSADPQSWSPGAEEGSNPVRVWP